MPDYGCVSSNGCYDTKACSGGLDNGILCAADGDCSDEEGTCTQTSEVCGGGPSNGTACTANSECEVVVACMSPKSEKNPRDDEQQSEHWTHVFQQSVKDPVGHIKPDHEGDAHSVIEAGHPEIVFQVAPIEW